MRIGRIEDVPSGEQVPRKESTSSRQLRWKNVALAAVAFWALEAFPTLQSFGRLFPWQAPSALPMIDEETAKALTAVQIFERRSSFLDDRVVFVSCVLLCFAIVRGHSWAEKRRRRGEVFTGVFNLYILLLAAACTLTYLPLPQLSANGVAVFMGVRILSAASWCLIGFHVSQGRILLPLVGIFLADVVHVLRAPFVAQYDSLWVFYALRWLLPGALNFFWQLGSLVHLGEGFVPFPTAFTAGLRRCATVFFPVAVCMFILHELPWVLTDHSILGGADSPLLMITDMWGGNRRFDADVAVYLGPFIFLSLPSGDYDRRSRRIIFLLFVGGMLLTVHAVFPFFGFIPDIPGFIWTHLPWDPLTTLGVPFFLLECLILTSWFHFIPMSIFRWWACGRFLRPLAVTTIAALSTLPAFLTQPSVEPGHRAGVFLSQLFVLVIVYFFLFRDSPRKDPRRGSTSSPG
jgi:hypothetical protein